MRLRNEAGGQVWRLLWMTPRVNVKRNGWRPRPADAINTPLAQGKAHRETKRNDESRISRLSSFPFVPLFASDATRRSIDGLLF